VELAPQVADVRLDDVRVAAEVVPPHILEDLSLREDALRVEHEEAQQIELGRGELQSRLAARNLVSRLVEHDVAVAQHVAREVARGTAEDRLHAGDELGEAERLRDVVVAAGTEGGDLVRDRVLRGQEEHGGVETAVAQTTADLEPVDVREHPVEHDQIRVDPGCRRERVAAGARLLDDEALVAERRRDGVDDRRLVVDDQDRPGRAAVHAAHGAKEVCESRVNEASAGQPPVRALEPSRRTRRA